MLFVLFEYVLEFVPKIKFEVDWDHGGVRGVGEVECSELCSVEVECSVERGDEVDGSVECWVVCCVVCCVEWRLEWSEEWRGLNEIICDNEDDNLFDRG